MLLPHDSFVWKEVADQLLEQNRIRVLYHSVFLKAELSESGAVSSLLLYTPEGMWLIRPKAVVDASGDAAVVHSMGGETSLGHGRRTDAHHDVSCGRR
jgi:FAD dependent oxidoreductase